ncbi:hypothetical protein JAAARDRAFT_39169 [Jaapia argillacea MUCL 33604]|uniref:t-SNARE coiled-coil homology domain-containing protein n=1 Tax=Jaapia argillacea MUCL 33604 TaxID=933084 RepID=A0A067PF17_9AGAM|nr:hypothetical protein JAAARDRAFT_39169 [Jaapia argillacea MUCL 33604]
MSLLSTSTSSVSKGSAFEPTTRSRTLLFRSYRDSLPRSSRFSRSRPSFQYDETSFNAGDEREGLIHSDPGHVSLNIDTLPPKWVDIAEHVEEIIADTRAKIAALDKLHAKHVLPGFSDRSAEEREIEAATTDITKNFRQCQMLIQQIGSRGEHSFPPSSSSSTSRHEGLAAKNVQRGLAAKVQELSATFRKKQRVYMEKLQGHAIRNQDLLVASGTISPPLKGSEGLYAVDEDVEAAAASRNQATAQDMVEPDFRQRDRELTEIAKSISQLAELFKDLSALVIDQGTLLDSIEYNIEQTAVHVSEAVTELNVAQRYQKNTGRRKCMFLLLLIIFGLILVLIFKPRRSSSSSTSPSQNTDTLPSIPDDFHLDKVAELVIRGRRTSLFIVT